MPDAPIVTRAPPETWTNHHGTVTVPIRTRITVRNGSAQSSMTAMRETAAALQGFTRFDPTCIIDIDGLDNPATRELMEETRHRFDRAGIPYAQHWGKLHGLTRERVRRAFGSDVDRWNTARRTLLPEAAEREVFSSALLKAIGLND